MKNDNIVDIDSKLVSRDLRERGLLTLTVRRHAGVDGDLSARLHFDGCALPSAGRCCWRWPECANLTVGGDADSHQLAFGSRLCLFTPEIVIADGLERLA